MMHYWKVRLTCFTPTFIGNGDIYQKDRYIYDSRKKMVSFLKEENWISFLQNTGIMDDFVDTLLSDGSQFNLFEYLGRQLVLRGRYGFGENIIAAMKRAGAIDREVPYYSVIGKSLGDIHAHVRDVEGNPYIPGSSLKGAFRTAILSHEIRKSPSRYGSYWRELERAAGNAKKMKETVDKLEREITIPQKGDMVKSYFRGLTVSDAVLEEGKMCVAAKADLTVDAPKPHQVKLYRECLDRNSALEFTVGIDDSLEGMGHYGITTLTDLLKILREFVDFQYDILWSVFQNNAAKELGRIKADNKIYLLLGGGTGFLSKTLIYSLAPKGDRQSAVEVVRRLLQNKFSRGHHEWPEAHILSPHTLKLVCRKDLTYLMGLCYLDEEKKLC